jgi:ribosome maturation factor RimP
MLTVSFEQIQTTLTEPLAQLGYEYVGAEQVQEGSRRILRIFLELLAVAALPLGSLILEVSSPGLARPLFNPAQCARFIGQDVKIQLNRPINQHRKFVGTLMGILDEAGLSVKLRVPLREGLPDEGELLNIPWAQIGKIHLVPVIPALIGRELLP